MMWYWGPGWSHPFAMWFGGVVMLLLLVVVITAIVAAASVLSQGSQPQDERSASLTILEQRYAKGEIQRDEYLQKVRDLVASH